MNDTRETRHATPRIWNPNAAANWSLLFSPAFGAILHAMNWKELGHQGKARANMTWAVVFIGVLLILPVVSGDVVTWVAFPMLVVWYFSQAKRQVKYVKAHYGRDYERNKWGKPLLLAVASLIGYFLLIGTVSFFVS